MEMLVKNDSSQSFRQQHFPWGGSCSGSHPQPLKARKTLSAPAGGGTHIVLFILPLSASSGSLRRRPPRSMRPPCRTAKNTALCIAIWSARPTPALMAPSGVGPAGLGWAEGGTEIATPACLSPCSKFCLSSASCLFFPFILSFLTLTLPGNFSARHTTKGLAVLSVS